MKVHRIKNFGGVNTYYDETVIPDNVASQAYNIDTKKKTIKPRMGFEPKDRQILYIDGGMPWFDKVSYNPKYYVKSKDFEVWKNYGDTQPLFVRPTNASGSYLQPVRIDKIPMTANIEKAFGNIDNQFLYLPTKYCTKEALLKPLELLEVTSGGGVEIVVTAEYRAPFDNPRDEEFTPNPSYYMYFKLVKKDNKGSFEFEPIPLYLPIVSSYGKPFEVKNMLTNSFKVRGLGYKGAYESLLKVAMPKDARYRAVRAFVEIDGKEYNIPSCTVHCHEEPLYMPNFKKRQFPMNDFIIKDQSTNLDISSTTFTEKMGGAFGYNKKVVENNDKQYIYCDLDTFIKACSICGESPNYIKKRMQECIIAWQNSPNSVSFTFDDGTLQRYVCGSPGGSRLGGDIRYMFGVNDQFLDPEKTQNTLHYLYYRFIASELQEVDIGVPLILSKREKAGQKRDSDTIVEEVQHLLDDTKKGQMTLEHLQTIAKHFLERPKKITDVQRDEVLFTIFDDYPVTLEVLEDRQSMYLLENEYNSMKQINGYKEEDYKRMRKLLSEEQLHMNKTFTVTSNKGGTLDLYTRSHLLITNDISKGIYVQDGNATSSENFLDPKTEWSGLRTVGFNKRVSTGSGELLIGDNCLVHRTFIRDEKEIGHFFIDEEVVGKDVQFECITSFNAGYIAFSLGGGFYYIFKDRYNRWQYFKVSSKIKEQIKKDIEWLELKQEYNYEQHYGFGKMGQDLFLYITTRYGSVIYQIFQRKQALDTYEDKEAIIFEIMPIRTEFSVVNWGDDLRIGHKTTSRFLEKDCGYVQIYLDLDRPKKKQNENGDIIPLGYTTIFFANEDGGEDKSKPYVMWLMYSNYEEQKVELVNDNVYLIPNDTYLRLKPFVQTKLTRGLKNIQTEYLNKYNVDYAPNAWVLQRKEDRVAKIKGLKEHPDLKDKFIDIVEDRHAFNKTPIWGTVDSVFPYIQHISTFDNHGDIAVRPVPITEEDKQKQNSERLLLIKDGFVGSRFEYYKTKNNIKNPLIGSRNYGTFIKYNSECLAYCEVPIQAVWRSGVIDLGNPLMRKTVQKAIIHIRDGKGRIKLKVIRNGQISKEQVVYDSMRSLIRSELWVVSPSEYAYKALSIPLRLQNVVDFQYEIEIQGDIEVTEIETLYDVTRPI